METRYKESWKLIFEAAQKLRDFAIISSDLEDGDFHHVTVAQQRVLEVIFAAEDGVMLKEVAETLGLTPGAVSQTVEILVRDGMVERYASQQDRRAVTLRTTQKCNDIRAKGVLHFNRVMENTLKRIEPGEREVFVQVLERVIEQTTDRHNSMRRKKKGAVGTTEEKK